MHNDIKQVLLTKEQIAKRVEEMGKQITADYEGKDLLVVGILKGSVMFFADLTRNIGIPLHIDFMVASSYGNGTETSGKVNIKKDLSVDIKGRHVLLVEDIIDSGITMSQLKVERAKREPASLKLCALLSKPSRRKVDVDIDYCGYEVPDEFLVGYGLDYAENYRNLPVIGVLKREIYS